MTFQLDPPIEPPPAESIRQGMARHGLAALKSVAGAVVTAAGVIGVTVLSFVESGVDWSVVGWVAGAVVLVWVAIAWVHAEAANRDVTAAYRGYHQRATQRIGYTDRGPRGFEIAPGHTLSMLGGNGGRGGDGGIVYGEGGNANGGDGGAGAPGGFPGGGGGGGGAAGWV